METVGLVLLLLFSVVMLFVILASYQSAYRNGVCDGYGFSREPSCPGYAEAGIILKATCGHRWPELTSPVEASLTVMPYQILSITELTQNPAGVEDDFGMIVFCTPEREVNMELRDGRKIRVISPGTRSVEIYPESLQGQLL